MLHVKPLLCLKFQCTGVATPPKRRCSAMASRTKRRAAVKIICPCCKTRNQVIFTPDGTIHGVTRARTYERIPEPSLN